ncbi:hypothetical protein ACSFA8_07695 [Variovorax sp. RT4R15]|uniref:hypothetical protein n=1 Tax=Variovorax sp. RT4R15 TaxID=3443737 RepID=UPI003F4469C5
MDANRIALIVEEPAPGQFFWALQRQESWRKAPVERAARPMPSYGLAMLAGMSALEKRCGTPCGLQRRLPADAVHTDFGPTTIAGTL